ncbi:MAG TPA: LD-carboxypeptidase [Micromonosporaceae bacterium]|nr:LD-carboxypeptidase [Micromonosporaceae bacterium]
MLPAGGMVGVVAPAASVFGRSVVTRGIRAWEARGFRVKVFEQVFQRDGYFAGSDRERAEAFQQAFDDPSVDVVQVIHGGYGSTRLIEHLDFDKIAASGKAFVGRSDLTALHLAIARFAGLVTFYGPGMADIAPPRGSDFTADALVRALTGAVGTVPQHPEDNQVFTLSPGRVSAPIVGGCLWPLCKTIGTPWQPDLDGKIFFLEEVGEPPWSIDAHLTHLAQTGMLNGVAGVVVGRLVDCDWSDRRPESPNNLSLDEVLERHLTPLGVPVLIGVPVGHERDTATIPLGIEGVLDASAGTLTFDQAGVMP